MGKVILAVPGAMAELERENIVDRSYGKKVRAIRNGNTAALGIKLL